MRKLSMLVVLIFGFNQIMIAQGPEVKFGAKAGLNLANMSGDDDDSSIKIGFHVGGMAEIGLTDKLAVQPELLYSGQGAKFPNGKLALNYLALPVLVKYGLAENFSLEAGPQFGFLLSAKSKTDIDDAPGMVDAFDDGEVTVYAAQTRTNDLKDNFKSFDLGVALGANYRLNNAINLNARYIMGLSNTPKDSSDEYKFKNAVIQISVGYFFN